MATINRLVPATPTSADQLPIYSATNGDARRASVAELAETVLSITGAKKELTTLIVRPTAAGFNYLAEKKQWLIIDAPATLASGTIKLPQANTVASGDELIISSTNEITLLTLDLNGALSVSGAPGSLIAGGTIRLRFDSTLVAWFALGASVATVAPVANPPVAPPLVGFNETLVPNQWLVLNPAGALANGTVTLPPVGTVNNNDQVLISSTQQITALTIAPNGAAAVYGAPTAISTGSTFTLRFDIGTSSWFRVA